MVGDAVSAGTVIEAMGNARRDKAMRTSRTDWLQAGTDGDASGEVGKGDIKLAYGSMGGRRGSYGGGGCSCNIERERTGSRCSRGPRANAISPADRTDRNRRCVSASASSAASCALAKRCTCVSAEGGRVGTGGSGRTGLSDELECNEKLLCGLCGLRFAEDGSEVGSI